MQKRHKKLLARIITASVLFVAVSLVNADETVKLFLYLIPYFTIGYDVLLTAVKNIFRGQMFDEKFLMSIATIGALVLDEYPEAVFVMLFFQVGDLFESIAVGKSRNSISKLMDLNPDIANVERDGKIYEVFPEEIVTGEILIVKPGEKIAIDGVVVSGQSTLDTSALTGEALPVEVATGDKVSSGCININGVLKIRTTNSFENSTASKIMEIVENSSLSKAKTESFITRFSRYYTPFVVIVALLLAVIPSVVTGNWGQWVGRALIFLVVSCPCALVISVPLSFFGGIGAASKQGILVKGSNYIEAMADVKTVVFDKTGTLTTGHFAVKKVHSEFLDKNDLLKYAASAEKYSNHPVAKAIRDAYEGETYAENTEELSGYGVKAIVDGRMVWAGNANFMKSIGLNAEIQGGTVVYIAVDGKYAGYIEVADQIKDDAEKTINLLKKYGIHTVMLTGDREYSAKNVAKRIGLDEYYSELLPGDKVGYIEKYIGNKGKVAFMGDGINDAPVLARADVGIAMGGLGADVAIEAADLIIMDDKPSKIIQAVKIAEKTRKIVFQNIVFALGIKFAVMILGALGFANMWIAVFADVGVSVIAILNAMRTLRGTK